MPDARRPRKPPPVTEAARERAERWLQRMWRRTASGDERPVRPKRVKKGRPAL